MSWVLSWPYPDVCRPSHLEGSTKKACGKEMLLIGKALCFSSRCHISQQLLLRPATKGLRANGLGLSISQRGGVAVALVMVSTTLAYARLLQPGTFSACFHSRKYVSVPMEWWVALWRSLVVNAVMFPEGTAQV